MVLFTVFKQFDTRVGANAGHMAYSEFLDEVRNNRIRSAIIQEGPGGSTEIVATTKGNGFLEAQPLIGPFPSGAPAIFIDQLGKLGTACAIAVAMLLMPGPVMMKHTPTLPEARA